MAAKKKVKKVKKVAKTGSAEQVGFHKGALSTLSKERAELMRMLNIVEQLMQMHIASLKELGIDLEKEADKLTKAQKGKAKKGRKKPIEDIL